MNKLKSIAIISVITIILLVISSEILFQNKGRLAPGNYVWKPNLQIQLEPAKNVLSGLDNQAIFSINEDGVRTTSVSKESSNLRILTIGGSTTECFYLDDQKAWPAVLDSLFEKRHWIGNIGRSGLNTSHHIITLEKGIAQYGELDYVIFLVGINDLNRDINHKQGIRIDNRSLFDQAFMHVENEVSNIIERLALIERLGQAKKNIQNFRYREKAQSVTGFDYKRWRDYRQTTEDLIDTIPDLDEEIIAYSQNIEELITLCHQRNIRPIFITQPTLYMASPPKSIERLYWMGGLGNFQARKGSSYYSSNVLLQLMNRYNQVLRSVCKQNSVMLLDLANEISADSLLFYDDCHFTNAGASLVADIIFEAINFIDD